MRCPHCKEIFDEDIANEKWHNNGQPDFFVMSCPHCKNIIEIVVSWTPNLRIFN